MKTLHAQPFDDFSPDVYLATLVEVAHSDGLHPDEKNLLEHQAEIFGIDLNDLPEIPEDLSNLSWSTRVLVYRDAVLLAFEDKYISKEEKEYLNKLSKRLDILPDVADSIFAWVRDYASLLSRMDAILSNGG